MNDTYNVMTNPKNVGEGWQPLLEEIEQKLAEIKVEYDVLQIKEKFGGLRYYINVKSTDPDLVNAAFDAVHEVEEKSFHICEVCGQPGQNTSGGGFWLKTLCPTHEEEREERRREEQEEMERSKESHE